jgi:adenine deaminase
MIVRGNIVDIQNKRIFKGEVEVANGKILEIREQIILQKTIFYLVL